MASLQRFLLSDIRDTGITVGDGAYSTVAQYDFRGLKCVGKKIHHLLYEHASPIQRADMLRRFEEECGLLGRLHHPNIVQFLGVHVETGSELPVLVMEYLPTTLSGYLDRHGVPPTEISYGILRDVALGLRYLHAYSPPIIHRDLSANNVLLTASLCAKISDLGVAKILNITPSQMTQKMSTKAPGTPCYMPPEVLVARASYTRKIDSYSFGIMILHVLCGEWPFPTDLFQRDPHNPGVLIPVTEVDRRAEYLQQMGSDHPLSGLVRQCLSNIPEERPESTDILQQINTVLAQIPAPAEPLQRLQSLRPELQQSSREEIETLRRENETLQTELSTKTQESNSLRMEVEALQSVVSSKTHVCERLERENETLQTKNESLKSEHRHKDTEVSSLRTEIERMKSKIASLQDSSTATREVQPLRAEGQRLSIQPGARPQASSQVEWGKVSDATAKETVQDYKKFKKAIFIKHIGQGSYGSVAEVQVETKTYAAKKFHGIVRVEGKLATECVILSHLQHPHIVRYCGICFTDEACNEPLLMMEKLNTCLQQYLLNPQNLDLHLQKKLSILQDIASGLNFLHQHKIVVVHRDLTANNVLLAFTPKLIAKIADFGNSRIAEIGSSDFRTTAGRPGTLMYMPPEAFGSKSMFGPKLDIFSFGHLALFTAIQILPDDLLPLTYYSRGKLQAYSEVKRREQYITKLCGYVGDDHALVTLVKLCLHNDPKKRPSAATLHEKLVQEVDKTTACEQTDAAPDSSDTALTTPHPSHSGPNSNTSSDTESWPDLL